MTMLTQTRTDVAASVPGPTELLPGCPDAVIDLQTDDGAALVDGAWRYSDAHVAGIDRGHDRCREGRNRYSHAEGNDQHRR